MNLGTTHLPTHVLYRALLIPLWTEYDGIPGSKTVHCGPANDCTSVDGDGGDGEGRDEDEYGLHTTHPKYSLLLPHSYGSQ